MPSPGCCRCAHSRRASPLACLAVCLLVLAYNLLGGFLFLALEGSATEETAVAASKPNLSRAAGGDLRSRTVERLWSITEDLNILYKENWTKLAAKELMDFQRVLLKSAPVNDQRTQVESDHKWTFATSFLYALTLITTIGHGDVVPRSLVGRMAAVAYACVGIPLVLLYLSTLGAALARRTAAAYGGLRRRRPAARGCRECPPPDRDKPQAHVPLTPFQAALNLDALTPPTLQPCREHARVPAILSLFLIAVYVGLGSLLFRATEKWSLIDGCYFSFSSLATIGFGDLRPGNGAALTEDIAVGVCCAYILVGIVVIATCFNLIQEDMASMVRGASAACAGKSRSVHVEAEAAAILTS